MIVVLVQHFLQLGRLLLPGALWWQDMSAQHSNKVSRSACTLFKQKQLTIWVNTVVYLCLVKVTVTADKC